MVIKCPVCGYRFDSSSATMCRSCPMKSDCNTLCCPNCHYGWVESSSLVESVLNFFKKRKKVGRS